MHPHPWAGPERWSLEKVDSHELYNLGHLYEAAVAHYQATGKRDAARHRAQDAPTCSTGRSARASRSIWPGHQITEMGLVKLYRATGEARYLDLAQFLLDVRGPDGTEGAGREYNQSHAEGRRAGARRSATPCAPPTCTPAWPTSPRSRASRPTSTPSIGSGRNVVGRKLYITGGIGATRLRRGVRQRLRAAQHERLQRDLRRHRQRPTGTTGCSCCTPTPGTST